MKRKKDRTQKPSRKIKEYLILIDGLVFDKPAKIYRSHRAAKIAKEFSCLSYQSEQDAYLVVTSKINRFEKMKPVDHFNNFIVGLLNTDSKQSVLMDSYQGKLFLPKIGLKTFLVAASVHEVRHRIQFINSNSQTLSTYDDYKEFPCFQYLLDPIVEHFKSSNLYSKKPHHFDIEIDAYMVQAIFLRELWINTSQRGMTYDEAIKASVHVIKKNAAELAEVMNSVSYVPFI